MRENMLANGLVFMTQASVSEAAKEAGVDPGVADLIMRELDGQGLLEYDGQLVQGGLPFIFHYETETDRTAFWESNAARRELLVAAADAFDRGEEIDYREGVGTYTERPYGEAAAAARMLDAFGLGELQLFLGKNFTFSITASGYELARDAESVARELPVSREEDVVVGSTTLPEPQEAEPRADAPSAFISYAHEDESFVSELVDELARHGVQILIDRVVLNVGDSLIAKISEAIAEGDFLIGVISSSSVSSPWCQKELRLAATQGIKGNRVKVLPVKVSDAVMPDFLDDVFWADGNRGVETVAAQLVRAMNTHLAVGAASADGLGAGGTAPRVADSRWSVIAGGDQMPTRRDAVAYIWTIRRDGEQHDIAVYLSRTALACDDSELPAEVVEAKATDGRSVAESLADVDDPPKELLVTTVGINPLADE
jgi:TIR domain-containing protein